MHQRPASSAVTSPLAVAFSVPTPAFVVTLGFRQRGHVHTGKYSAPGVRQSGLPSPVSNASRAAGIAGRGGAAGGGAAADEATGAAGAAGVDAAARGGAALGAVAGGAAAACAPPPTGYTSGRPAASLMMA